jgi:hypothetical protein
MKRFIFASLLIAGLMISADGFSQRYVGYRGGFRGGCGFAPRGFYRPFRAPVIYGGPAFRPVVPAYGYGYPAYYNGYYRGGHYAHPNRRYGWHR